LILNRVEKGLQVLPAGWNKVDAAKALVDYRRQYADQKLRGYLFTTWGVNRESLVDFQRWSRG